MTRGAPPAREPDALAEPSAPRPSTLQSRLHQHLPPIPRREGPRAHDRIVEGHTARRQPEYPARVQPPDYQLCQCPIRKKPTSSVIPTSTPKLVPSTLPWSSATMAARSTSKWPPRMPGAAPVTTGIKERSLRERHPAQVRPSFPRKLLEVNRDFASRCHTGQVNLAPGGPERRDPVSQERPFPHHRNVPPHQRYRVPSGTWSVLPCTENRGGRWAQKP